MRALSLITAGAVVVILMLDGLDVIVISLVAPAIAQEFALERAALGPVLAAALVGMLAGAPLLGTAGDRWGRRPLLLLSTLVFSAASFATLASRSSADLTLWRFLTGVGLGGAVPNAIALLAEYMPRRWRNYTIAIAIVGVPLGGMLGAHVAPDVIAVQGWRAMFILGGILPLVAAALVWRVLPESPRFLANRGNRKAELARVLNTLSGTHACTPSDEYLLRTRDAHSGVTLKSLLGREHRRDTLGIWLVFFTNLFSVFTFLSWAPLIFTSLGLAFPVAARGLFLFNLAGIVGGILTAWLVDTYGSRAALLGLALLAAATLVYFSMLVGPRVLSNPVSLMAAFAGAGFALISIQVAAYGLSAHIYPTRIRSAGVAYAASAGRVGSIASTLITGRAFQALSGSGLFGALALMVCLTLVGIVLVRGHIRD